MRKTNPYTDPAAGALLGQFSFLPVDITGAPSPPDTIIRAVIILLYVGVEWTGVCCPFDEHICLRVVISIRSFQSFLDSVKLAVGRRRHRSFRWIIAGLSADLTRTLPGKKSNFVDWCTLFLFRYYSIKLKEVFEWILKRNSWSCEKWKSLLHLVIHRQKFKIYIIILTTFVCKKHPQVTLVFFSLFLFNKSCI